MAITSKLWEKIFPHNEENERLGFDEQIVSVAEFADSL
jgi:hypothetical protein